MASESKEAVAALETKFGEAGDAQFLMNGGFSLGTHVNIIELNGDMVDIIYIYMYISIYNPHIYIYIMWWVLWDLWEYHICKLELGMISCDLQIV